MSGTGDNDRKKMSEAEAGSYSPWRTLRAIAIFLVICVVVGLSIGLMSGAPWMRVSPDCSVLCVFAQDIEAFFAGG